MGEIVAVVTVNKDSVAGGAPIFIEKTKEKLEETAFSLEKILDAAVHDLKNGTYILVNHQ